MSEMKVSRRKFLTGSAATAGAAAVATSGISLLSERAEAFFNAGAFWKKPVGSGQTSNGYTIGQSLRFSSAAFSNLSRTPVSLGNQKTWTFSGWIKRGKLGSQQPVFSSNPSAGNVTDVAFDAGDLLYFRDYQGNTMLGNTQSAGVYRDPSGWYHIVAVMDRSNATASNRMRLYVNGVRVDAVLTSPDGSNGLINSTSVHNLGVFAANPIYFDGHLSEVYFIDGQALDSSYFGQTDTNSGQWIPKLYSGTYGINGFYLKFVNSGSLGQDSSPNGNNFSATNFATHDQVLDSPTNNFGTLNPLNYTSVTESAGNLTVTATYGTNWGIASTFGMSTGKWYWEATFVSTSVSFYMLSIGISQSASNGVSVATMGSSSYFTGICDAANWGWLNGTESSNASLYPHANSVVGNIYGFAFDAGSLSLSIYTNGALTFTLTGINAGTWFPAFLSERNCTQVTTFNFGQGGQAGLTYDAASGGRFKYTPPAGFKALSTANLAAPTIKNPGQYFNAVMYTGTGASKSLTGVGFQPDFVWLKSRTNPGTHNHIWFDSSRLASNYLSYNANTFGSDANTLTAFTSNGFNLGSDASNLGVNISGETYAAWAWKKGAAPGFDIQTYTGNGDVLAVNHNLNAVPAMMLIKGVSGSTPHVIAYHKNMNASPASGQLYFETMSGTSVFSSDSTAWNNILPTSTNVTVGASGAIHSNNSYTGVNYVVYLWAEVAGFSKFGSYTGNGSADGPFVYCGFKPRWVLFKSATTASTHWIVYDGTRNTYNLVNLMLNPSTSGAELVNGGYAIDLLSNGFKCRDVGGGLNAGGETMVFAAFAEAPFKYATAR
jgi:hypothetical protein